jgi:hypothetical protein
MKKSRLLAIALLSTFLIGAASRVRAQPAEAASPLNVAQSMGDNLRRLAEAKKPVEIVLRNGKSYKGKLGAVGDHSVVVSEIAGREFYDGLVLIDEIVAVEVRARER